MATEKLWGLEIVGADQHFNPKPDAYQARLTRLGELADARGISHNDFEFSPEESQFFERVDTLIQLGKAVIVGDAVLGTSVRFDQPDKPNLSDLRYRLGGATYLQAAADLKKLGASIITAGSVTVCRSLYIGDGNFIDANFALSSIDGITIGDDNIITGITSNRYDDGTGSITIGSHNLVSHVRVSPSDLSDMNVTIGNNNTLMGCCDVNTILAGRVYIGDNNEIDAGCSLPDVSIGDGTSIGPNVELPANSLVHNGRKIVGGRNTKFVTEGTNVEVLPLRPSQDSKTAGHLLGFVGRCLARLKIT